MASFAKRLEAARKLARHPRIRVVDLEDRLGTRYTVDTLAALRRRLPRTQFVWLMGADILLELKRWRRWPEIFSAVPVAVFARPTYCHKALAAVAAQRFARSRVAPGAARRLAEMQPPAWTFQWMKLDPRSATAIRRPAARRRSKTAKG